MDPKSLESWVSITDTNLYNKFIESRQVPIVSIHMICRACTKIYTKLYNGYKNSNGGVKVKVPSGKFTVQGEFTKDTICPHCGFGDVRLNKSVRRKISERTDCIRHDR